ncbi:MAG: hypothetical protein AVDCRST_MAG30-4223 [uncultured Solirubrobacteraceae bacterium]|uniref:Alkaline phosphatase n=1 Tax=uncultured Solirubrobacteraceae bacterium TaxID=1162706 RepID=A0A6J4TYJ9_9ACTN|nr:MAG: hypothetical protein AVDCRST_MAG30-4223 [uncultured Solirubrobacteraceae bacterium]
MTLLRSSLTLCALLLLLAPAAASAGFRPGGPTPGACTGAAFGDRVGTLGADTLAASERPERVYGLQGADTLRGGPARAACLFGGRDPDLLQLGAGGGIILGEEGADIGVGSDKDDALSGGPGPDYLLGRGGRDVLRGDTGVDAFEAGPGDDAIVANDGRREVVACGPGTDAVALDATDLEFGCERVRRRDGRTLPRLASPRVGRKQTAFRLELKVPRGAGPGSYGVIAERCDQEGPVTVSVFPEPGRRVRTGQRVRVGLRPPGKGWCLGNRPAALVRLPACGTGDCLAPLPAEPLARVTLRVRAR